MMKNDSFYFNIFFLSVKPNGIPTVPRISTEVNSFSSQKSLYNIPTWKINFALILYL